MRVSQAALLLLLGCGTYSEFAFAKKKGRSKRSVDQAVKTSDVRQLLGRHQHDSLSDPAGTRIREELSGEDPALGARRRIEWFNTAMGGKQEVTQELVIEALARHAPAKPLVDACRTNNKTETLRLLANGADPNLAAGYLGDEVPLEVATAFASVGIVRALLNAGAGEGDRARGKDRALMEAAIKNRIGAARLLIQHGADVNFKGGQTNTPPLYAAAFEGNNKIVKALVVAGADINQVDDLGLGPLHQAAHRRKTSTVELLLALGAEPDLPDLQGETPLQTAEDVGATEISQMLLAAGAKPVNRKDEL
jgi:hypothetical protein